MSKTIDKPSRDEVLDLPLRAETPELALAYEAWTRIPPSPGNCHLHAWPGPGGGRWVPHTDRTLGLGDAGRPVLSGWAWAGALGWDRFDRDRESGSLRCLCGQCPGVHPLPGPMGLPLEPASSGAS